MAKFARDSGVNLHGGSLPFKVGCTCGYADIFPRKHCGSPDWSKSVHTEQTGRTKFWLVAKTTFLIRRLVKRKRFLGKGTHSTKNKGLSFKKVISPLMIFIWRTSFGLLATSAEGKYNRVPHPEGYCQQSNKWYGDWPGAKTPFFNFPGWSSIWKGRGCSLQTWTKPLENPPRRGSNFVWPLKD